MTNNIEGNNTGLNVVTKQDPAPLPTSRHSKLTPQLKFFWERKFVSYLDWHLEVSIKSFGKNQASWKACSRWHKAFGFNMLKPRAKVLKLFTRHCWSSSIQVWWHLLQCKTETSGRCYWLSLYWHGSSPRGDSRVWKRHWCSVEIPPC